MPTQAQRQRDWEFLAELKPGSGMVAGGGAPEPEGSAADRDFLASWSPGGVPGSGNAPWSPPGKTEGAAAFGRPSNGNSWGLPGTAEPASVRANGDASGPGGSHGVPLVANRPDQGMAPVPGQAQRGGRHQLVAYRPPAEPRPKAAGRPATTVPESKPTGQSLAATLASHQKTPAPVSPPTVRRSGIFVGEKAAAPASPYANAGRYFEAQREAARQQPPGAPVPRGILPGTVDPLTLKPVLPTQKVRQRIAAGSGDPGTPVTVERNPNEFPGQGALQTLGRMVPGVGAAIEGHERIYAQWFDAVEAGLLPRAPLLARPGSPERKDQEASLRRLRPLLEAYNAKLTQNLRGRQQSNAIPLDGALVDAPFVRDLPNLYLENGKRWNWNDFGAFLREQKIQLTPWETKVLTAAIQMRKIEWATKAATDLNVATEVALAVASEIAGGALAPVLLKRLAPLRKAAKPLVRGVEELTGKAPKPPVGRGEGGQVGEAIFARSRKLAEVLAPNRRNLQNAIANGLQEALSYTVTSPDPRADEAIWRALQGGTLGYLFESGLHLGASGWQRLRQAYHQAAKSGAGNVNGALAAELRKLNSATASGTGGSGVAGKGPVPGRAAPPGGHATTPNSMAPPKGAAPPTELTTAPGSQPGAVGVSGEPALSAATRGHLVQIREAAQTRVAARQSRKAPARLPRGPKGTRPGAVIGPDALGAELGDLLDYALIGATHLAEGVLDRTEWNLRMVAKEGEQIRPHLEQIRELARRINEGWKARVIPTQGARVREAARAYLLKLAEPASPPGRPGRVGAGSHGAGEP